MTENRNMEAVKTIYKILSAFEKQLDAEDFDPEYISPERLKVSQQRRDRYLQMLIESEYITGMGLTTLQKLRVIILLSHSVNGSISKTLICEQISSGMLLNIASLCVSIYKQDVLIKLRIKIKNCMK